MNLITRLLLQPTVLFVFEFINIILTAWFCIYLLDFLYMMLFSTGGGFFSDSFITVQLLCNVHDLKSMIFGNGGGGSGYPSV